MRTTPAYETNGGGHLFWRVAYRSQLVGVQGIVDRLLVAGVWGAVNAVSHSGLLRDFSYIPSDLRLPIGSVWTDEA